ncbi:hypothetical protein V5O48_011265 [Marasmius crinis-equi]|uniref:Uncharacterized protein n=1 Tax=Marasmius crinis-equi TaxID=585013 RepID=A0ABR3F622_9AGAR
MFVIGFTIHILRDQILDYEAARTGNWDHLMEDTFSDMMITASVMTWMITTACLNAVADCTLIHRCYIVWASKKLILYPLVVTSVLINGVLLGSSIAIAATFNSRTNDSTAYQMNNAAFVAAAVLNFTLTLMTAGRIWWISREAREGLGKRVKSTYTTIVAITIESGFIYSTSLLVIYIIVLANVDQPGHFDATVVSTQLSALAPTLLIVRVAYNKSVDSVYQSQKVSTLAFADRSGMQESRADRRDFHDAPPAAAEKAVC